jgi:hypothetical protein
VVGLVPVIHQPLKVADQLHPAVVVERPPVLVAQVHGVHEFAINIELELGRRAIADPHRRRAQVALQMREFLLRKIRTPVDAVHDL